MPECNSADARLQLDALQAINGAGYGFQVAALRETELLFDRKLSNWAFEVEELPVETHGNTARVDFVLRERNRGRLIAAECKRVGPGEGWCFARSPFVRYDHDSREVVVERLERKMNITLRYRHRLGESPSDIQHWATAFKSSALGQKKGNLKQDAVDRACHQAVIGASGLVNHLAARPKLWEHGDLVIIPAVVTTAPLFALKDSLDHSALATGDMPAGSRVAEVPWLWIRQHVNPSATSEVGHGADPIQGALGPTLSRQIDGDFGRTIAVVNCSGIEAFLSWISSQE